MNPPPLLQELAIEVRLLRSGVDIAVIALWLGHEGIETTYVYFKADLATTAKALQKLQPVDAPSQRYKPANALLAFLNANRCYTSSEICTSLNRDR